MSDEMMAHTHGCYLPKSLGVTKRFHKVHTIGGSVSRLSELPATLEPQRAAYEEEPLSPAARSVGSSYVHDRALLSPTGALGETAQNLHAAAHGPARAAQTAVESPVPPSTGSSQQHSFVDLDPDVLACLLSWLTPVDLAGVAVVSHQLHEPIERAANVRAAHLRASLAPFRGLAVLQILHVKEMANERSQQSLEVTRLGGVERVRGWRAWHSGVPRTAQLHEDQFVYNSHYGMWMPESADPHAWAAENLAVAAGPT